MHTDGIKNLAIASSIPVQEGYGDRQGEIAYLKGAGMFKRIRNAKVAKDKNNTKRLEVKPDKATDLTGKRNKPTSISVQSPNGEMTIIGEGVIIDGKISGSGNLVINGLIKGDIDLEENILTVGPQGRIEGEIIVKDAVINGQMNGKVKAMESVNIAQHADFCGDIKARSISIDDGALFNGKIVMDREPDKKTPSQVMSNLDKKQDSLSAMPKSEPTI